jgi:hypothetical protein
MSLINEKKNVLMEADFYKIDRNFLNKLKCRDMQSLLISDN